MISYAQAREDVILHRALHHVHHDRGFYVDVGAYHPVNDSVTKHFYDHGWHGINIEPSRDLFPAFAKQRPNDINLQVAVSDTVGEVTFHTIEGQLGTVEDSIARQHIADGWGSQSYTVPTMTLSQIFIDHAPRDVQFLKIDIEGHEAAAIRGMNFVRFRPWVLVVEATIPNRYDLLTHHEWEGMLATAGYQFVLSDLPNRYYVANEHPEIMRSFSVPADDYQRHKDLEELDRLRSELDRMQRRERVSV